MGVTIHFEGQLFSEQSFDAVLQVARQFATGKRWHVRDIPAARRKLQRVRNEQDWDYEAVTKGLELLTHPDCERVRLEFDDQLYIQEYTKTQFAPVEVHVAVVGLLRVLEPEFANFSVVDEGEYFETGNLTRLIDLREGCNRAIEEHKRSKPKILSAVKLPSGRIVDLCG